MIHAKINANHDKHCLTLKGSLIFPTIQNLRDKGNALIKSSTADIVFDFEEVVQCDSSALALLTAWARQARKYSRSIRFINLPQKLKDLACLSNLNKFLPIENCTAALQAKSFLDSPPQEEYVLVKKDLHQISPA